MASLDAEIDKLYRLPPSEFTAERNALARTVTGADAQRVKRLQKPTAVPWAVNQLHWQARGVLDRLLKTGAVLRSAQVAALKGERGRADLDRARQEHRKALGDAIDRAMKLAKPAQLSPDRDALSRMLEAISLAATPLPDVGRLTEIVQPAGFEALAGTGPLPELQPRSVPEEELRQAKATARRAAIEIEKLENALTRAHAAQSLARRNLERAEEQVRVIEAKLLEAKSHNG